MKLQDRCSSKGDTFANSSRLQDWQQQQVAFLSEQRGCNIFGISCADIFCTIYDGSKFEGKRNIHALSSCWGTWFEGGCGEKTGFFLNGEMGGRRRLNATGNKIDAGNDVGTIRQNKSLNNRWCWITLHCYGSGKLVIENDWNRPHGSNLWWMPNLVISGDMTLSWQ